MKLKVTGRSKVTGEVNDSLSPCQFLGKYLLCPITLLPFAQLWPNLGGTCLIGGWRSLKGQRSLAGVKDLFEPNVMFFSNFSLCPVTLPPFAQLWPNLGGGCLIRSWRSPIGQRSQTGVKNLLNPVLHYLASLYVCETERDTFWPSPCSLFTVVTTYLPKLLFYVPLSEICFVWSRAVFRTLISVFLGRFILSEV